MNIILTTESRKYIYPFIHSFIRSYNVNDAMRTRARRNAMCMGAPIFSLILNFHSISYSSISFEIYWEFGACVFFFSRPHFFCFWNFSASFLWLLFILLSTYFVKCHIILSKDVNFIVSKSIKVDHLKDCCFFLRPKNVHPLEYDFLSSSGM